MTIVRLSINDLLPDTQYAVQLRAVGPDGASEWSNRHLLTTISDTVPPENPVNVSWVSVGDSFHAEWDAVTTNEDGQTIPITRYEIELVAGSDIRLVSTAPATGAMNTYDLTFEANAALFTTPRPSITFRVRAVDDKESKSDWSFPAVAAANAVPGAPTAPATGAIATPGVDSIALAWTPPADTDIIGYNVYVGSTAGFVESASNKIFSGNSTRFTFTTTNYTTQYFKIKSVDRFNQESTALTANAQATSPFAVDATAPNTPTGLASSIVNNANGIGAVATVTWAMSSPPADLAGFYIRYRRVGTTNYQSLTFQKDARAATIELQFAYTNYEFQIKAFDWSNNESAWSATVTATSPANANPSAVTGFTSTPARDAIRYDWVGSTAPDLKEHQVRFSTDNTFSTGVTTFRTSANTMVVSGLPSSTTYYAQIRAVDTAGGASAWSATDTEQTLDSSSSTSVSDLTGGEITDVDIVLGPGGDIVINGGHIRSNTYTYAGQTGDIFVYNEDATAGWYIGNDGLVIVDGAVSVGALKSGTIDAETITLSGPNGKIVGGSWELSGSGLSIPDGAITAAKLMIQAGQNVMPPSYSDFEAQRDFYLTLGADHQMHIEQGNILLDQNALAKFNSNSLAALFSTNTLNPIFYLAPTATTYNIPVEAGKSYIFSAYVWCSGAVATNAQLKVKWSNGAVATLTASTSHVTSSNLPASGTPETAVRLAGHALVPAGVTGCVVFFESSTKTNNAGINIDGVQVEEKISGATTPSAWTPGTATRIDGGLIRTGQIRSNTTVDVGGIVMPSWSIDTDGDAVFSNALIRGNTVVGASGEGADSYIRSFDYAAGVSGWAIRADGYAEFRNLASDIIGSAQVKAGSLTAAEIDVSSLTADRLTVGSKGVSVLTNGSMEDKDISPVTGTIDNNGFGGWHEVVTTGNGAIVTQNTTNPISGTRSMHLAFNSDADGARMEQTKILPVTEGQRWVTTAKARFSKAMDKGAVIGGSVVALTVHTSTTGLIPTNPEDGTNIIWQITDSREDVSYLRNITISSTAGSTTVTAPAGSFLSADEQAFLKGVAFEAGTKIVSYVSDTEVEISEPALSTTSASTEVDPIVTLKGVAIIPPGHNQMVISIEAIASGDGSGYSVDFDEIHCSPATEEISIIDQDGLVVASINSAGDANFRDIDYTGTLLATGESMLIDGQTFDEHLSERARGVELWGRRTVGINKIKTEYGVLEASWTSPPDASERYYLMVARGGIIPNGDDSLLHGRLSINLRATTAALGTTPATPTISSPLVTATNMLTGRQSPIDWDMLRSGIGLASDTEYRFLLTMTAGDGLEYVDAPYSAEFLIIDQGPLPPQSGKANSGGGTLYTGGSDSGGTTTTPVKKTYTKTWGATWSRGYNSSGNIISANEEHKQGYYSGTNGNTKAAVGFDDGNIRATLAGVPTADILKVEVYLYFSHWYYNAGGTAIIGTHGHGSPVAWTSLASLSPDQVRSANWPKPGGRWVDITHSRANWRDGPARGITLGPGPSTSRNYYGTFRGYSLSAAPKLRITYKK